MKRRVDKLSVTLGRLLKSRGLESSLSEYRIVGQWEKAVGAGIARHAQPQFVQGKKLVLVVDSPAWMQQLSLLKPELIEKMNKALGREAITGITLKLGEVVSSTRKTMEPAPVRAELDPKERAEIEASLRELRDPDIKEIMRHLLEKDVSIKKAKKG
jgi:hypothetical protein